MFKRTKVAAGVLVAVSGYLMLGGTDAVAQAQSVSVTGSKIKRTDAEGSLPVTTYNRADLDSSGAASVAMRCFFSRATDDQRSQRFFLM